MESHKEIVQAILDNKENLSPAEVETKLIEQAEKTKQDPAEIAAMMFTLYLPRFKALVDTLSSRAKTRVLNAIIEVPLNDKPYNFSTNAEREAFAIGERLTQAKFMLIQSSFMEHNEELKNALDDSTTSVESESVEQKGESNGG